MEDEIQFYVVGIQGKKHLMTMSRNCTVAQLFAKVLEKGLVPAQQSSDIRLVYDAQELQPDSKKFLYNYNIQNLGSIYLVVRMRGGFLS